MQQIDYSQMNNSTLASPTSPQQNVSWNDTNEIPFNELSMLFLDYLKHNKSKCAAKSQLILNNLARVFIIITVYNLIVSILCIISMVEQFKSFAALLFSSLMQASFCGYVILFLNKQSTHLAKKSTITRKIILLKLLQILKDQHTGERIRIYRIDQDIAQSLKYLEFIVATFKNQIGIILFLFISTIINIYIGIRYFTDNMEFNLHSITIVLGCFPLLVLVGILIVCALMYGLVAILTILIQIVLIFLKIIASFPFILLNIQRQLSKQNARRMKLRSYKMIEVQEIEQCAVCLGSMEHTALQLPCQHYFHQQCVEHWMDEKNDCPICRHAL